MRNGALFLVLITFLFAVPSHAQIYKWTDAHGVVHFQDTPPQNRAVAAGMATLPDTPYENGVATGSGTTGARPAAASVAATTTPVKAATYQNAKVEVYGTSWCPWCKKTLAFFRSRGIAVKDYDIEKDKEAARRKFELDPNPGIPTVVVNGRVIHGYSPTAFERALKASR
jgi:glutaredoxin